MLKFCGRLAPLLCLIAYAREEVAEQREPRRAYLGEVGGASGSGHVLVPGPGQHGVHGVAHLMEKVAHHRRGQKGGLRRWGGRKVQHQDHDGGLVRAILEPTPAPGTHGWEVRCDKLTKISTKKHCVCCLHSQTCPLVPGRFANEYTVPAQRRGFGGLSPLKQCSKPLQIEIWNTINKEFLHWSPLAQTQSPHLFKTFWRRFCEYINATAKVHAQCYHWLATNDRKQN